MAAGSADIRSLVFTIMTAWHYGVEATQRHNAAISQQPARFFAQLRRDNIARLRGTAVFLTRVRARDGSQVPAALRAMIDLIREKAR
jgi:K+ transporter